MSFPRFLYTHLAGQRARVAVAIALTFGLVSTDILTAFPLKFILDKVAHHQDPAFPLAGAVLDRLDGLGGRDELLATEAHTQLAVIALAGAMFLVLSLLNALMTHLQLRIAATTAQNLGRRLRTGVFAHLERLPLDWHGRQRTGDLVQRITGNVADIEKLVTDGLVDLLSGILTLVGIVVVMALLSWQFTVISMVIVPPLFVIVLRYTLAIKKAAKTTSKAAGHVAEVASEDLTAIAEVKGFTLEQREEENFARHADRQCAAGSRGGRLQSEFSPLVLVLLAVGNATLITIGGWIAAGHGHRFGLGPLTVPAGAVTVGSLTVFLAYSKLLYQPMKNLSKLMNLTSSAASGAERLQEILDEIPEMVEPVRAYRGNERLRGEITLDGVVFGYASGAPVLRDVDLHVAAGRRIALVGLSGSGKTTLVKLIPRFFEAWAGSVRVDGIDVEDYPLDVLRNNISLVLQESVLFEGTVRENIALGRPDATDEEVAEAARKAHIHDTIAALPGGYGAHVREGGKNFSGGQRQRLAIARAILRDAPILILDEPTASLDVEAEAEVMRALQTLVRGRTVLMISHRLSTLGSVDEIVVLDQGRIIEQGSYRELSRAGGMFARLLEEQNRYSAGVGRGQTGVHTVVPPASPAVEIGAPASWQRLVGGPQHTAARASATTGPPPRHGLRTSNSRNSEYYGLLVSDHPTETTTRS
jgi:ABC-type multidrug transport system fused ATPase/permease subunit